MAVTLRNSWGSLSLTANGDVDYVHPVKVTFELPTRYGPTATVETFVCETNIANLEEFIGKLWQLGSNSTDVATATGYDIEISARLKTEDSILIRCDLTLPDRHPEMSEGGVWATFLLPRSELGDLVAQFHAEFSLGEPVD